MKRQNEIDRLRAALDHADAVVIGAGAGLSTSAGFTYDGERFEKYFSDFAVKYGIAVLEVLRSFCRRKAPSAAPSKPFVPEIISNLSSACCLRV